MAALQYQQKNSKTIRIVYLLSPNMPKIPVTDSFFIKISIFAYDNNKNKPKVEGNKKHNVYIFGKE